MSQKIIKNAWNAGELSQYMDGRTDLNKYYNGASKMINALVLPHGGFTKRPGTKWIGKAPNKANLLPFEFSVDDALILEFSNILLRFYKDGDRVYESDVEIASTTEGNPVLVTTDAAHSFADDEWVYLEDINTATSLNDKIYQITVTGAGGATKFTLQDTEGNNIDGTGIGIGGALGSCKRVYQIVSPYTSARAFNVHVTQSADVMYIAHNDVHPKKLSRLGATNWTIVDVPFTGGPFLTENTTDASLVGFARTGGTSRSEYYFPAGATGTLTATAHTPFNTNMIGALWLIKHTRDNDNDTDTFAKDTNVVPTLETFASGAIFIKGNATVSFEPIATGKMAQLWRKTSNGKWQTYRSFRGATAFSWTEDEDDILYAMTRSDNTINGTLTAKEAINYGIVKVTAFTNSTVVTVEVIDKVLSDNSTDNAITTSMWAEGAWSTYRGFPRTVGFHEDRLWWASSTNDPDRLWASQSGLYEDMSFSSLGADNEAVTPIIKDNEVSQIQWFMSRRVMAIGAANREYSLAAQNPEDPITPLDKKSTPQTGFSSSDIQPVMLNDSIFFLQRQGKKLGAMKFDSVTENFVVDDATLLAYGLLDSTPTNMAVSRSPDSLIWVVRTDGVLPTFTYEPKEEVSGWGRQIFGNSAAVETPTGFVESVAVIHGTSEDEIWVNLRRVIDSSTVYYTELFAARFFDQIDEALMLDSAVVVSSAFTAQNINLASDTVRYNNGLYNSSLYGGVSA